MNLRRVLSQAALIIGTLVFAIGLQAYAQTYTAPTTGPTGGNAQAPLDTGSAINYKKGELLVNIIPHASPIGGLGFTGGTATVGTYHTGLVVGGNIIATGDICSGSGGICLNKLGDITGVTAGTGLTGGGTSGNVTLTADYGGSFEVLDGGPSVGSTCTINNPVTNSCSCPSGYNQSLEYYTDGSANNSTLSSCYNRELVECVPQGFPYTPFTPGNFAYNSGYCSSAGP